MIISVNQIEKIVENLVRKVKEVAVVKVLLLIQAHQKAVVKVVVVVVDLEVNQKIKIRKIKNHHHQQHHHHRPLHLNLNHQILLNPRKIKK